MSVSQEHEILWEPASPREAVEDAIASLRVDGLELDEFGLVDSDEPCASTGCGCGAFWTSVQASFGLADAGSRPQVIKPHECRRTGRRGWYLWWT